MHISVSGVLSGFSPPSVFSIAHALNGGWTGTLSYAELIDHRIFSLDATVVVTITDEAGEVLATPPMKLKARQRARNDETTTFELMDLTSHKLSGGSESFDTFVNADSDDICAAIATRFGVSISGVETFPIWKEDIKLSNGWGPLQRLAVVAGQQLMVDEDGDVVFVSNEWTTSGVFKCDDEVEDFRPDEKFGKIFISKNLGAGTLVGPWYYNFNEEGYPSTTLDPPITNAVPLDVSGVGGGFVAWVGFWDSEDKLIVIHQLNSEDDAPAGYSVPLDGSWPAVRFTCIVTAASEGAEVNARLQISGTPPDPPPEGIDPAFAQIFGAGRGLTVPFQESLIPSLEWAEDHWEDYLRELNRGKDMLRVPGPLNCSIRLGLEWDSWFGHSGRAESITWSGNPGANACRTDLEVNCG